MITVNVKTFAEWRLNARHLLANNKHPTTVFWDDVDAKQVDLFATEASSINDNQLPKQFFIAKKFLPLAKTVAYHRNPAKWNKLYYLLWRLTHGEPYLLNISSDQLIHDLLQMQKAVTRDAHKMKAFVRFCKFDNDNGNDYYLAWYKPDHLIVRLVAPFFQTRFAVMHWSIITPDETVCWNGKKLYYEPGKNLAANPKDELELLWQTYYKAIFNPARIKIKAMKKEMPVRFWHNLPETQMIPTLLSEAPQRVEAMMQHQEGIKSSAEEYLPPSPTSLSTLKEYANTCQGCLLHKEAIQTVFGLGSVNAQLILVGEQPGDKEDSQGLPFVGPAGQLLKNILQKLAIQVEDIYITNTVKHFKFKLQNGRRIHQSPNIKEINACKPWLLAEIQLIKPRVILCLGLTAAKALINPAFRIKDERGQFKPTDDYIIGATYHPSAILRVPDIGLKESMLAALTQDISKAYQLSCHDNF